MLSGYCLCGVLHMFIPCLCVSLGSTVSSVSRKPGVVIGKSKLAGMKEYEHVHA